MAHKVKVSRMFGRKKLSKRKKKSKETDHILTSETMS